MVTNPLEEVYLEMLRNIISHGKRKPTRAILQSTGKNIHAISLFGYQARFDLQLGFPAVTTKKLAFKTMVRELLWFLSGDTNVKTLQDQNVHIWDEWADPAGDLGPIYGKQWRSWATPDGQSLDQMLNLINGIEAVKKDPTASVGRRLIVTAWNPADLPNMKLPPCHALFQFSVTDGQLSCQLYQRSADAFLGVPFNIASYALLTYLLAQVTGLQVGEFIHSFGDLHIYENHLEQVTEQLLRNPYPAPKLILPPHLSANTAPTISNLKPTNLFYLPNRGPLRTFSPLQADDISLDGYECHPALKGEVAK